MANVLGQLFGDIANAIREKTGDTASMKPAEFPDQILAIAAGGSGGTLVGATGKFTGTGAAVTVAHNLGTVPLFVLCFAAAGLVTSTAADGAIRHIIALSSQAANTCGLTADMQSCIYWNKGAGVFAASTPDYTIEETKGTINSATETTVVIGKSEKPNNGTIYEWLALGIKTE